MTARTRSLSGFYGLGFCPARPGESGNPGNPFSSARLIRDGAPVAVAALLTVNSVRTSLPLVPCATCTAVYPYPSSFTSTPSRASSPCATNPDLVFIRTLQPLASGTHHTKATYMRQQSTVNGQRSSYTSTIVHLHFAPLPARIQLVEEHVMAHLMHPACRRDGQVCVLGRSVQSDLNRDSLKDVDATQPHAVSLPQTPSPSPMPLEAGLGRHRTTPLIGSRTDAPKGAQVSCVCCGIAQGRCGHQCLCHLRINNARPVTSGQR